MQGEVLLTSVVWFLQVLLVASFHTHAVQVEAGPHPLVMSL